jgi:hypothetical protein
MNSAGGGGGRDRDKGRKYQSGSGKRKAKEERAAREKKVLSKMPKISEMFSTKTSNSAVLETVDIVSGTHLADNLNPEIFKELEQNTHYVDTTAEVAAECKSVCDDDHIDTTNLNSPSYLPDLGLWPTLVSENMREYWIAKGSSDARIWMPTSVQRLQDLKERSIIDNARKVYSRSHTRVQNSSIRVTGFVFHTNLTKVPNKVL